MTKLISLNIIKIAIFISLFCWCKISFAEIDHWYETQPSCVTDRGNPGRTGEYNADPIEKKPKVLWVGNEYARDTSLTCYKDFIISNGPVALNIKDGKVAWRAKEFWQDGFLSPGTTLYKGILYTSVNNNKYPASFVALNPENGSQLFVTHFNITNLLNKEYNNFFKYQGLYSPIIYNNVIYISLMYSVLAYDLIDHKILWQFNINPTSQVTPLSTDGKRIYFSDWNSTIYALDMNTGKVAWKFSTAMGHDYISIYESKVYFYSLGTLYALNGEDGKLIWKTSLSKNGSITTLAIANKKIFVNDYTNKILYSLDSEKGKILWKSSINSNSSPIVVKNIVYLLSKDELYAFDEKTGKKRWYIDIPYNYGDTHYDAGHTIVAYQDKLFVINNHRVVIALQK